MSFRLSPALALAAALTSGSALADRLILSNGDRYSGQVQSMEDGQLGFRTEYGQLLQVPWELVAELHTDDSVRLMLNDDSWVAGRLEPAPPGRAILLESETLDEVGFELADVAAINPPEGPGIPAIRTSGRLNFGASKTTGNTRTETFRSDAEFVARTERNRYTLSGELNYGQDEGERNRNDAAAFARYDHFVGERWYLNSNAGLARDEFRNLALRTTFGAGVGYQFLQTADHRLSAEIGANHVHETFRDDTRDSRPAARLGLDYERGFRPDGLSLFHRSEVLQGLDASGDRLLRSRTGLRFPLLDGLSGTLQVNLDYDHQPPPDSARSDLAYLFTLGYAWQ